jgi:hypothetical protein
MVGNEGSVPEARGATVSLLAPFPINRSGR